MKPIFQMQTLRFRPMSHRERAAEPGGTPELSSSSTVCSRYVTHLTHMSLCPVHASWYLKAFSFSPLRNGSVLKPQLDGTSSKLPPPRQLERRASHPSLQKRSVYSPLSPWPFQSHTWHLAWHREDALKGF